MSVIPTNDVFHSLILLLVIHKDKELIIDMFKSQKIEVTKSQLKRWSTRQSSGSAYYQPMPREALEAFIAECFKRKLVELD